MAHQTEVTRSFSTTRRLTPTVDDVRSSTGTDEHGYGYRPAPAFKGGNPDTSLMFGVELETGRYEVRGRSDYVARYLHEHMGDRVYCKHDGSIDGTEIVSHPATLAYHMRKFGWADVLGIVDEMGGKSHDALTGNAPMCGLHVHVGRKALGSTDDARELCIAKLLILTERFYDSDLLTFSRRGSLEDMLRWARKTNADVRPGDKREKVLEKAKSANCNTDRYTALNLTNHATIEFRIFRGTLNMRTFAATLQLVDAMVRFCKTRTLQQVLSCTFGDVAALCKYGELPAYCRKRNIDLTTSDAAAA